MPEETFNPDPPYLPWGDNQTFVSAGGTTLFMKYPRRQRFETAPEFQVFPERQPDEE